MCRLIVTLPVLLIVFSTYGNHNRLFANDKFDYHSNEAKVRISFPLKYDVHEQSIAPNTKSVRILAEGTDLTYMLIHTVYSNDAAADIVNLEDGEQYQFVKESLEGFASSLGKIIEEKDYQYKDIKGRQAKVLLPNGRVTAYCKSIYYDLVYYQLVVFSKSRDDAEKKIEDFFNSFEILE